VIDVSESHGREQIADKSVGAMVVVHDQHLGARETMVGNFSIVRH